jgi:hypothetical protein
MTEREIAGFLGRYDATIQTEARAARRALRKAMPSATELVYDNYNALVFAYATSEKATDLVLSIALYPKWITLFFRWGAELDDPEGVLEGSGKIIRGVRLRGGAKDLEKPAVRALIRQAIARAKTPLAKTGRVRTTVRAAAKKVRRRKVAKR